MGQMISIEGADGVDAYLAPRAEGAPNRGGLIVIEEIWGLNDHIKDICDRFAAQGYTVLSPDLLGRIGITAELGDELATLMRSPDEAVRTAAQPRLREAMSPMQAPDFGAKSIAALKRAIDVLVEQPGVGDTVAVTGFCFGGTYTFAIAAADPRVRVAAPFYGAPPASTEVAGITAPVLAFYGERDQRLIDGLPEVTAAMTAAGVDFMSKVYPGTGHAFFNDTNPHAYDEAAATDAWQATLAFFESNI